VILGVVMAIKELPLSEVTLRKYEKPGRLKKRELVKKLCLSLGLLQPGDSRDVVVDILYVLLMFGDAISSEQIRELVTAYREEHNLVLSGVAGSNIRRQLKRLRALFLVEKVKNKYRITECQPVGDIFQKGIRQYLVNSMMDRIQEYCVKIDEEFSDNKLPELETSKTL
jgi:hypothetical protein